jgi:hypothetical protein
MTPPLPPSKVFPTQLAYPVVPPEDYWLLRWHWLKDSGGDLRCFCWSHLFGWHGGHGGLLGADEMEGWAYYAPALPPLQGV